jgi:hypothetical protein
VEVDRGLILCAHELVKPYPTGEVIIKANAYPWDPRLGVAFDAHDHADQLRRYAWRPVLFEKADPRSEPSVPTERVGSASSSRDGAKAPQAPSGAGLRSRGSAPLRDRSHRRRSLSAMIRPRDAEW